MKIKLVDFTPHKNTTRIDDSDQVSSYLMSGAIVYAAAGKTQDELSHELGDVVPMGLATDGQFSWPLALEYYVRTYALSPDQELLDTIRSRRYECPTVDQDQLGRIRMTSRKAAEVVSSDPEHSNDDDDFRDPFKKV